MPTSKLRFSPAASVTPTDSGVILRSDLETFQLEGSDVRLFVKEIVPLLDGTRDADLIADALPGYTRSSVHSFLELLVEKGLVEQVQENEGDTSGALERWTPQQRFFHKYRLDDGVTRLQKSQVLIVGLEPWGCVLASELAASGVGKIHLLESGVIGHEDLLSVRYFESSNLGAKRRDVVQAVLSRMAPWCNVSTDPLFLSGEGELNVEGDSWDLIVTALTADDLYLLLRVSRYAHAAGVRTLFGHLDGVEAWIGPAVVPGETACWNCFRLRRLANAEHIKAEHDIDATLLAGPGQPRARALLAPMAALTGQILAMEAVKLLTHFTPSRLPARVYVQNLISGKSQFHTVIRMPWCELCGGAVSSVKRPGGAVSPKNEDETSEDNTEGDKRVSRLSDVADIEGLRNLLDGWIDPQVGIIRGLFASKGGADASLLMTASAVLCKYTDGALRPAFHENESSPDMGAGKGLTVLDAYIGAIGEAFERYSASRYRLEDLRVSSFNSFIGDALDPRRLCLYDDSQYEEADFPFARFDPDQPIHWVEGYWFGNNERVWVPALPAFFNFHASPQEYFCQVSSSGLAAGSDLNDAALRATFELIERDAAMLSWMCQIPGERLKIDASLGPELHEIVRRLKEDGIDVELYLMDLGTGIPTVFVIGLGDGEAHPAAAVSLAAHTSLPVAVRKAILELAHFSPLIERLMKERKIPQSPDEVVSLEDHALYYVPRDRLQAFDFLRQGSGTAVSVTDRIGELRATASSCAERLAKGGLSVAIVDVTSPDVAGSPFRVARALGMDMQPIHFGHRFARLANPRLKSFLGNRALNPHPHPIA
jgi:ribosomal protein S12 methylthiotransferase accessory factor